MRFWQKKVCFGSFGGKMFFFAVLAGNALGGGLAEKCFRGFRGNFFFFFLRFWRENMVLVGKCVIRLLCVFANLVGKCIFTVLVGKIHFYCFDKKVFLRVWPKSVDLRVWLKNVFMENVFLRFCIFCSFGGNVRFLVITKKFICKKN